MQYGHTEPPKAEIRLVTGSADGVTDSQERGGRLQLNSLSGQLPINRQPPGDGPG